MMKRLLPLLLTSLVTSSSAWTTRTEIGIRQRPKESATIIRSYSNSNNSNDDTTPTTTVAIPRREFTRREVLDQSIRSSALTPAVLAAAAASAATSLTYLNPDPAHARATEEKKCDPGDARCRQGGELGDVPSGKPIPAVTNRITYVVQMIVDIGERRENDAGYLRFGLYGDDCPKSVKQLLLFLTRGITSMDKDAFDNSIEVEYAPVSLSDGSGAVQNICPGRGIDFGVASQSRSYSRSRGLRSAGPNFVPQGRPVPTLEGEGFPRAHDVAGLISVPARGIGYGTNTGIGGNIISSELSDDEIYSSAFTITEDAASALDVPNSTSRRRVIGQVIDNESMQFLDRLANLPVQKKLGMGGGYGPPLLKVRVRDVDVQKVKQ